MITTMEVRRGNMIVEKEGKIVFDVKVFPGSSKNFVKVEGELVKVWVTSQPEKGKANDAVKEIIAKKLAISKSNVKIISGETSEKKKIEVRGISNKEELVKKLNEGTG